MEYILINAEGSPWQHSFFTYDYDVGLEKILKYIYFIIIMIHFNLLQIHFSVYIPFLNPTRKRAIKRAFRCQLLGDSSYFNV